MLIILKKYVYVFLENYSRKQDFLTINLKNTKICLKSQFLKIGFKKLIQKKLEKYHLRLLRKQSVLQIAFFRRL